MQNTHTAEAVDLMMRFADRTGLTSRRTPRRYLWTDAFAVCNFIGLARATGDAGYGDLALRLVDQVHHVLGRHRPDDRGRTGWISGLPEGEADAHPTRGGLRIGKPLPERNATEPPDPNLEWDRDGQYFHYLTKWMHALDQVSRWTGQPKFNLWARELADAAHRAFTYGPPEGRRMMWKLSIDLSRPLVRSMGQHDPLDGFVTCTQLEATAAALAAAPAPGPNLAAAAAELGAMLDPDALSTNDPLGIGGLLVDASRLAQLGAGRELIASLLEGAAIGLAQYWTQPDLRAPPDRRLAFRELGLAIGIGCIPLLEREPLVRALDASGLARVAALAECLPLRAQIDSFWLSPDHRRAASWIEHEDINDVMLATSLAPDGFLALAPPARASTVGG
jgi:hypothetical protein